MINGIVNLSLEPMVRVEVRGPTGQSATVDVIIDTGFFGHLLLPPSILQSLGASVVSQGDMILADGQVIRVTQYMIYIEWDGLTWPVTAIAGGGSPLIGMALLHGFRVDLPVRVGETVTITALPARTIP